MDDLRRLNEKFRDAAQLGAVREIVQTRLADDERQEECRYLMRFWWQLIMTYREVVIEELEENLSLMKFTIIKNLIDATDESHEAIDEWIQVCIKDFPVIEDKGFQLYESDTD